VALVPSHRLGAQAATEVVLENGLQVPGVGLAHEPHGPQALPQQ
jgi:hypothetical protein